MNKACLEQIAYGTISPKIVIIPVETIKPTSPEVKSPIKIDIAEFTVTLPNKMVHNKRFPCLRNGKILFAYSASFTSCSLLNGPFVKSSKFLTSSPSNPRFKPENAPDIIAKIRIIAKSVYATYTDLSVSGILSEVKFESYENELFAIAVIAFYVIL